MGESALDGQDVVDKRAHRRNTSRQAAGTCSDTKARQHGRRLCLPGGLHVIGTKAQCVTPQYRHSDKVVERFGPTAGCKARA